MSQSSLLARAQTLLQRPLTSLEQFILISSWQGLRYGQMAVTSGYGEEYMKQVGARLWAALSEKAGTPITKKNLRLLLTDAEILPARSDQVGAELGGNLGPTGPLAATAPIPRPALDYPSGPLGVDSALYINRPPLEETAYGEIGRCGCLLCIKAPRRFGKTSLLLRLIAQAQNEGYRPCRIDLQEADGQAFDSIDLLLRWFSCRMARELGLDLKVDQVWDLELGSKVNCGLCLEQALAQADSPLLLTINALEQVFPHEAVARDFLSMLRFWHERSKDDGIWQRLRLVLVYATDAYVALDFEASPFNVGHSLHLPPFTLEQFLELGRRYHLAGLDDPSQRPTLDLLYRLIAGHPFWASLSFYTLTQEGQSLSEILKTATTTESIFRPHLQAMFAQLRHNPAALAAWQQVIEGQGVKLHAIDALRLESLGLIRLKGDLAYPLCELYRRFYVNQMPSPVPSGALHG
ncbi:MAG TPA: AAA-like domain-containing protein [Leptolyngbyaceae cyanobacterium M65_K2018_010]|nr:AAA-like domain-containing protein [Leptolyngbyaceae cyanobacterium M65_K2018_010]